MCERDGIKRKAAVMGDLKERGENGWSISELWEAE